jgi:hypothetical protein
MSIERRKEPSVLAPLADHYELTEAGADRILAKIQTAVAENAVAASRATTVARSGGGKLALLFGSSCAALAIVGATYFALGSSSSPAVGAPVRVSQPAPMQPSEPTRDAPVDTIAVPSVSVDSLPSVVRPPSSPAALPKKLPAAANPDVAAASSPGAPDDTLQRETRLITDARLALEHGNGDKALALLAEHSNRFPNGWFAGDRDAERIIVLCSLGRRAEAVQEATAFLEKRPKGPLTRRVESSCAGQSITKAGK